MFKDFRSEFEEKPEAKLFWLTATIMRVGLFRPSEILYKSGEIHTCHTFYDLEVNDLTLHARINEHTPNLSQVCQNILERMKDVRYWSLFLPINKTDQVGLGQRVFI